MLRVKAKSRSQSIAANTTFSMFSQGHQVVFKPPVHREAPIRSDHQKLIELSRGASIVLEARPSCNTPHHCHVEVMSMIRHCHTGDVCSPQRKCYVSSRQKIRIVKNSLLEFRLFERVKLTGTCEQTIPWYPEWSCRRYAWRLRGCHLGTIVAQCYDYSVRNVLVG